MNILAIGDVVGSVGCRFLRSRLPALKKTYGIDLVIANGENSADGNGITPVSAEYLYQSGVDVITGGNHSFRRREAFSRFDEDETLLRPLNYPAGAAPGNGYCLYDMGRLQVGVVNLIGTTYMESMPCPFEAVDTLLKSGTLPKITLIDFHCEATSEKRAMGFFLDGRVSAVFGTHTHVPTADEQILPRGTGYITDLGMTGVQQSVLGVKPEIIIQKLRTHMPARFDLADGDCRMDTALFTIDEKTGRCTAIQRLSIL